MVLLAVRGSCIQDCHEGFLGDIDRADRFHPLLAFLLFSPQFPFAGDIATVAFGGDVFAKSRDGFACDDSRSDGGLDGHFEHVSVDFFLEFFDHRATSSIRVSAVADDAQGIDAFAVDEDIHAYQIGFFVADDFVVHGAIATGCTFQFVVKVVDDFSKWQIVADHGAGSREVFVASEDPASVLAEFHGHPDVFGRQNEVHAYDRLAEFFDIARVGDFLRAVDFKPFPAAFDDFVGHIRSGLDQVDIAFVLEALLDDFHMQEAEETAAKAEPEGFARLGSEFERGVVDREFFQGISQFGEVLSIARIEPAVDHAFGGLVTFERFDQIVVGVDNGIADTDFFEGLDIADQVADFAGGEFIDRLAFGDKLAEFEDFVVDTGSVKPDLVPPFDFSRHEPHVGDRSSVVVVVGIEHHGLEVSCWGSRWGRDAFDDGRKEFIDSDASFSGAFDDFRRVDPEDMVHFGGDFIDSGVVEVDFVDDRNDFQVVVHGRIGVGDGLGFDALEGIDQEQGSFAAGQRAGDFVLEVDVAGGIDEVQLVEQAFVDVPERYGFGFDGDSAFAFEIHRIEELLLHLADFDRSGPFEQAVG